MKHEILVAIVVVVVAVAFIWFLGDRPVLNGSLP